MHKRDWVAVSSWLGIAAGLWIIAWIISAAIPVFSNLLSLIVGSMSERDKARSVANLTLPDCPLRLVVQLLPRWCILAVHQQGPIDVLAADDSLYCDQSDSHWDWTDDCMLCFARGWGISLLTF